MDLVWFAAGLVDVMRNKPKSSMLFSRYFIGNGIPTWLLAPFNLFVDLLSYSNPGIYTLDDFPPEYRREIEDVLDTFRNRREEIISKGGQRLRRGAARHVCMALVRQAACQRCSGVRS
jgi:aspartyl/asparaginyl beta-hydroxylase (cupin superfamily)